MSEILVNDQHKEVHDGIPVDRRNGDVSRVAVLAVHGVNAREPFETARSIAKMLLRSTTSGDYPDFKETQEHVLVEPVKMGENEAIEEGGNHKRRLFDDRAPSIRAAQEQRTKGHLPIDHSYMADQIREYTVQHDDAFYDTVEIKGHRLARENHPACHVHVFELFWADLSRRAFGAFQGFIELYEILFFLCGLGRKTLDFARAAHPNSISWMAFGNCQALAEHTLTLAIPVTNLCLLAVASLLVPEGLVPYKILLSGLSSLYIAVALGAACNWALRRFFQSNPLLWPFAALVIGVGTAAAPFFASYLPMPKIWASDLCLLTTLIGVVGVCALYDRMKRGALFSGIFGAVVTFAIFAYPPFQIRLSEKAYSPESLVSPIDGTAGRLLWILNLAWCLLLILIGLMTITGALATRNCCRNRSRCCRAAWTANVTIILPAILVVILISAFWKIITSFIVRFLPQSGTDTAQLTKLVENQINAQGANLIPFCLVVSVAAVVSAWALLPVIFADVYPPNSTGTAESKNRRSVWMGLILNYAYRTLRAAGELLRWVFLISLIYLLLGWIFHVGGVTEGVWHSHDRLKHFLEYSNRWGARTIAALGAFVVLILTTSTGPLSFLVVGFRSIINVALDVVAWLRFRPASQNPKGRISARYVSLLRHICANHKGGSPYDALVIVAHSQGVMLTVDLLRFLTFQHRHNPDYDQDTALTPLMNGSLPVYLLTFGSPLRQLYDLRFPNLYEWAYDGNKGPDASTLGVKLWLNGYRSGDYVGRYLWHKTDGPAAWTITANPNPIGNLTEEFCLGEGAHTHYFDETSPAVPEWLNQVVTHAISAPMVERRR
jgi:hypothetical protein